MIASFGAGLADLQESSIGGIAAVILEVAESSVRSGVWDHSSFRKDAVMRLRRTGAAAKMTVYGPRAEAERMIARVGRRRFSAFV
ncbi:oxygenase MpaB family protein [Rhizobium laguerreae]|uniref:oxygenase MpaB family protein n=1 Tax=Rhizobium laguerreae TaxID=1076926 RepID=UPI001FEF6CBF|nr:oxygenase MpaB family protein [Rhizobium laguerreae]